MIVAQVYRINVLLNIVWTLSLGMLPKESIRMLVVIGRVQTFNNIEPIVFNVCIVSKLTEKGICGHLMHIMDAVRNSRFISRS